MAWGIFIRDMTPRDSGPLSTLSLWGGAGPSSPGLAHFSIILFLFSSRSPRKLDCFLKPFLCTLSHLWLLFSEGAFFIFPRNIWIEQGIPWYKPAPISLYCEQVGCIWYISTISKLIPIYIKFILNEKFAFICLFILYMAGQEVLAHATGLTWSSEDNLKKVII